MRVCLITITVSLSHMNMIHTGDLQLQSLVAVGLESIQQIQDMRSCLVCVGGELIPIHCNLKLMISQCDGQFKLLVDDKWESSITFFR